MTAGLASPAFGGGSGKSGAGKPGAGKPDKAKSGAASRRRPPRAAPSAGGLEVESAVFGKGDLMKSTVAQDDMGRKLAKVLAGRGRHVITGGGKGFPAMMAGIIRGKGLRTIDVVPGASTYAGDERTKVGTDTIETGMSSAGRSAPLARLSNVRYFANGGIGTLAELTASLFEPGVLAFLESTGGLAQHAQKRVLPFVGRIPPWVRVVHSEDPEALVAQAESELGSLPASKRREMFGYEPGPVPSALSASERERPVVTFLAADQRATPQDRAALNELYESVAASSLGLGSADKTIVLPQRDARGALFLAELARKQRSVKRVVRVRAQGPSAQRKGKAPAANATTRFADLELGHSGAAEFASYEAIAGNSDVVFISSMDYRNLAGLAFAMRGKSARVIGVLELSSTHGDQIRPMLDSIGELGSKLVFAKTAEELVEKVEHTIREQDQKAREKAEAKARAEAKAKAEAEERAEKAKAAAAKARAKAKEREREKENGGGDTAAPASSWKPPATSAPTAGPKRTSNFRPDPDLRSARRNLQIVAAYQRVASRGIPDSMRPRISALEGRFAGVMLETIRVGLRRGMIVLDGEAGAEIERAARSSSKLSGDQARGLLRLLDDYIKIDPSFRLDAEMVAPVRSFMRDVGTDTLWPDADRTFASRALTFVGALAYRGGYDAEWVERVVTGKAIGPTTMTGDQHWSRDITGARTEHKSFWGAVDRVLDIPAAQ